MKAATAPPLMPGAQTLHLAREASLQSPPSIVPQRMGCHSPSRPLQQGIAWAVQKQVATCSLSFGMAGGSYARVEMPECRPLQRCVVSMARRWYAAELGRLTRPTAATPKALLMRLISGVQLSILRTLPSRHSPCTKHWTRYCVRWGRETNLMAHIQWTSVWERERR